jgi:acetylornithine deacetylase/succinyl-diaminopimelate desuccinylase-like protein
MLLVRNRTGISHAPDEHVEVSDADVAVRIAARMLE